MTKIESFKERMNKKIRFISAGYSRVFVQIKTSKGWKTCSFIRKKNGWKFCRDTELNYVEIFNSRKEAELATTQALRELFRVA